MVFFFIFFKLSKLNINLNSFHTQKLDGFFQPIKTIKTKEIKILTNQRAAVQQVFRKIASKIQFVSNDSFDEVFADDPPAGDR